MSPLPRIASQLSYRLPIGAGLAMTAAALIAHLPARPAVAPAIVQPLAIPAPVSAAAPVTPEPAPAAIVAPVRSSELMFVFVAGGEIYVKLEELARGEDARGVAMPRHGKIRRFEDDGVHAAVATVAQRNVPATYASWRGRKLKVDNTCEATVVGFAVVSRLVGDPGYGSHDAWDAEAVMSDGHRMLAAKLDDCTGTYARTATLPEVIVPVKLHDAALEQAAIEALIGSEAAHETEREWRAQASSTGGRTVPWRTDHTVTAQVLRHPGTGERFVSVHGHVSGGCGEPEANVWGLFRVVDGKLVTVQLRQLGEIQTIDALIDVEGDGELELLGKPWLGDALLLTRANGDEMAELSAPFFGCPC